MAAMDFGMALARGMLPTSEKAQKDLIDLAGGRNIFKSEDWWNQQVDKQIDKGYRESVKETKYLMPSGEYKERAGTTTTYGRMSYGQFNPIGIDQFGMPYRPQYNPVFGYGGGVVARTSDIIPEGAVRRDGKAVGKVFDVFKKDADTEYFTAGELTDIEKSAKAGAAKAKRQTEQSKASQKRLRRGTGGLAAKARPVGSEVTTGLPALGVGGLGLGATTLGKGLLV
jgi:hypothetical protein